MDIEKTIQFLLEQQARFDARQAQFVERQAEFVERQAEFVERQAKFDERQFHFDERLAVIQNILQDVASAQVRASAILEEMAGQHRELERSHAALRRDTELSFKALSDSQNSTEKRLNALIAVVEGHIANHK